MDLLEYAKHAKFSYFQIISEDFIYYNLLNNIRKYLFYCFLRIIQ